MKSKELMVYNLPDNEQQLAEINAKPNVLFSAITVLSIISIILWGVNYYNIALIFLSLCAVGFMPKVILMEFYDTFLVLYNRADKNKCELIYYEEIVSWHYSWGANKDYLVIELMDGSSQKLETFSKYLFEYQMNRFLKDKHRKYK